MGGQVSQEQEMDNTSHIFDCMMWKSHDVFRKLFTQVPSAKVWVHAVPTQGLLAQLNINDSKLEDPEEFYERYYDTYQYDLLNGNCWLRERAFVNGNKNTEWIFQEKLKMKDGYVYQEHRGNKEDILAIIKNHINLKSTDENIDLASHCPIIVGAFLVQRFYLLQESEPEHTPYLDRCYFDLEDASDHYRYTSITLPLQASSNYQPLLSECQPAHTAIAEYLRRNWLSRYCILYPDEHLTSREGDRTLDSLLPVHPHQEKLHNINPRKYQALEKHKAFQAKLCAVKQSLIPGLLKEGHCGKYAICSQDEDGGINNNVALAKDQFEASASAKERKLHGDEVFVFPISQDSLDAGPSDGAVLAF